MAKRNNMNFKQFQPGRNIWTKSRRLIFLSFERLIILFIVFIGMYFVINTAFSYLWDMPKILYVLNTVAFGIFLIRTAPSNPNSTMLSEVTVRVFQSLIADSKKESLIIEPIDID